MTAGHHMILLSLVICLMYGGGCTAQDTLTSPDFLYKTIPLAKGTVIPGTGSHITFRGAPLALTGSSIAVGESLRSVKVTAVDLSQVDITESRGNIRIISIVPSLDTKVCEQQTHYLSEKNNGLDSTIELITVSIDTPFAQARFAQDAHIHNVTFLSDYRNSAFGRAHGLFLEDPHLLARAVIVVDQHNMIHHLQVNPDLGTMPDLDQAFDVARGLIHKSPDRSLGHTSR